MQQRQIFLLFIDLLLHEPKHDKLFPLHLFALDSCPKLEHPVQQRQAPAPWVHEEPKFVFVWGKSRAGIHLHWDLHFGSHPLWIAWPGDFKFLLLEYVMYNYYQYSTKMFLGQVERKSLDVLTFFFFFSCKMSDKTWECCDTKIKGCFEASALSKDEKQTGQKPFCSSALCHDRGQEQGMQWIRQSL